MENQSILYVEDDDAAALLVQIALEEFGSAVQCYRVSDVDNALKFLAMAGEYQSMPRPDLILLDLNLPRKSGFEVLTAVRQSKLFDHIPVVVFTSSAAASDRNKALVLGASRYVRKPASFDEYRSALRELIQLLPATHTSTA